MWLYGKTWYCVSIREKVSVVLGSGNVVVYAGCLQIKFRARFACHSTLLSTRIS